MNSPFPALGPAPRRNWVRLVVEVLIALAVVAVAAAAFVFSYEGVHAIALFGGVSAPLARYYPGLFDAVLVIACVAAVVLRDGRWWARLWAWLVAVIVLAAIGYADVLHATSRTLSQQETAAAVAAAPAAAVLLAFSLLVALLQRSKTPAGAGLADLGLAARPPAEAPEPPGPPAAPPTVATPAMTPVPPVPGPVALPAAPAAEDVVTDVAPPEAAAAPGPAGPALDPEPEQAPAPRPRGIRYAGGGFSETSARAAVTGPGAAAKSPGDLDSEEPGPLAGLVYQDREASSAVRGDDAGASPLARAPYPSVPGLNRVRSMPAPPSGEDE